MTFSSLGEFLNLLADRNDLVRVSQPVRSHLELGTITSRVAELPYGAALLFDNVDGQDIPVAINMVGTADRLLTALDVGGFSEMENRIDESFKSASNGTSDTGDSRAFLKWPAVSAKTAPSQQVVHLGTDVNLTRLPALRTWPDETLPVLPWAFLLVEPTEELRQHVGQHQAGTLPKRLVSRVPIQIRDERSLLIHWSSQDPEWELVKVSRELGQDLDVAVILGGDPVLEAATTWPVPDGVDAVSFAGFLRQKSVELVTARSVDLSVTADAEFIIEGRITVASEPQEAPPLALPTGFYSIPRPVPVLTVTAVTHRANPVIPATLTGTLTGDVRLLGTKARHVLRPLIRFAEPDVIDVRLPRSGAFRNLAFVSVRETRSQNVADIMDSLWGQRPLSTVRMLIVVDEDVSLDDEELVWQHVTANAHPDRDFVFSEGLADPFDHASPVPGRNQRVGIDATGKATGDAHPRPWPKAVRPDSRTRQKVEEHWSRLGIPLRADWMEPEL